MCVRTHTHRFEDYIENTSLSLGSKCVCLEPCDFQNAAGRKAVKAHFTGGTVEVWESRTRLFIHSDNK